MTKYVMNTSGTYSNASGGGKVAIIYDYAMSENFTFTGRSAGFEMSESESSKSGSSATHALTDSWWARVTATASTGFSFAYFNSDKASNVTSNPYTQQFIIPSMLSVGTYNVSIYFSRNKYAITYNANGGILATMADAQTVYYQAAIGGFYASASRTGYTFEGWYSSATGGTKYTTSTTITSAVTLYAHWAVNTYTISYNANGASGAPSSSTYIYGRDYTLNSTAPTRTGYTFSGWSLGAAGRTLYQAGATISGTLSAGNHTWYANWTINTYTMRVYYYQQCVTDSTSIYVSSSLGSGTISSGSSKTLSSTYSTTTYTITVSRNNSSYDYYLGKHSTPTTSSSVNSLSFTWAPTYSDYWYIYVYQKYVITYDGNGATGGTVPTSQNKVYGTSVTLSANNLTRDGYEANGWNTSTTYSETPEYCQDGSLSSYSTNASATLYANFLAQKSLVTVNLMTISKTGEVSNSADGGYVRLAGYIFVSGEPRYVTELWAADTTIASNSSLGFQTEQEIVFNPYVAKGYLFFGVSSNTSPPEPQDSSAVVNTWTPTQEEETVYVFFKECSQNVLKYDETEKYYYFEDGYMPQTYAEMISSGLNEKITNNGTLVGTYSLENGTTYKLASYDDNYYLGFTATKDMTLDLVSYETSGTYSFTQGTLYWFRFEPIRWRITDYGTTEIPEEWSYYGSYNTNYTAVSDLVLWYDRMDTNENHKEGDKAYDLTFTTSLRDGNFETMLTAFASACTDGKLQFSGSSSVEYQKFGETGQQNPVQIDTTHTTSDYELTNVNKYTSGSTSSLRVASTDEISDTVGNTKAKASCLVAFLMGSSNTQYSKYWTRDLGVSLNAGKVIAKNGLTRSEWLTNSNGIRFAYTISEGSRGTL